MINDLEKYILQQVHSDIDEAKSAIGAGYISLVQMPSENQIEWLKKAVSEQRQELHQIEHHLRKANDALLLVINQKP